MREATRGEAIARAAETPHIILNAPLVGQRLGYAELSGLDLLELFAFIHPAKFAVPTPAGLSRATGVEPPANESEAATVLQRIASSLLQTLADPEWLAGEARARRADALLAITAMGGERRPAATARDQRGSG